MLFWIVEAMAGFVECFISSLFIGDVLGVETRKYRKSVFFAILVVAGLLLINRVQLYSTLAMVYGVIVLTLYGYVLYRKNIWDIFIAVISYFLLLYLSEFLLISLVGILLGRNDFGAYIVSRQSWMRVLFVVIVKITLIILYFLFHKLFQKITIESRRMLIGVLVAFELIINLEKRLCQKIEGDIVSIGILLFLTVIMGIYLILQYSKIKKQELQMELTQERNLVMMRGYEDMMQNYRNNAIYYHDLKNHMLTLERFLINGEYDKAINYMKTLQTLRVEVGAYKWTGIEIVDFILNYKKETAEKKGISFVIDADSLTIEDMEEADLCALFGNLLDNAVEGCERENGERGIRISIRKIREMLMIKAVNTCHTVPSRKDGFFLSSKEDKSLHGWGIKSMKMIAEKYGGTMKCEYKNGEFNVVLTFFF